MLNATEVVHHGLSPGNGIPKWPGRDMNAYMTKSGFKAMEVNGQVPVEVHMVALTQLLS